MKLRQLIGSLGTVTAPADFDFRLRAKLAHQTEVRSKGIWPSGLFLGRPGTAVAAVLLVAGAVLALRSFNDGPISQRAALETTKTTKQSAVVAPSDKQVAMPQLAEVSDHSTPSTIQPVTTRQSSVPDRRPQPVARQRSRVTTREYSSVAAEVVKPDKVVASADPVFTIDASDQPMSLSLDDGSGIQRTISLPRISFGSQRAFAGEPTSMVKTSAKGVW
jgi:hypothetical protein